MEDLLSGFEKLKISAFSKFSKLTGDINNVTIGPNSKLHNASRKEKTPEPPKEKRPVKAKSPRTPPPLNQVLREFDTQRREKVQEAIDDHYKKLERFSKLQKKEKENQRFSKQQAFIQNFHEAEQRIMQAANQPDSNLLKKNEDSIKNYQDLIQRKIQFEQKLEKNKEKQRVLNEYIEKIKKCQLEFRVVYQEIIAIIKTCTSNEELKIMMGENFKLLKILPDKLEEIIAKCSSYSIDENLFLQAVSIVNQIKQLKNQIEVVVLSINKKKEPAKPPVSQATPVKTETKAVVENKETVQTISDCVSVNNLKRFAELKQFLSNHCQLYKDLLVDEQLKQFRFDCKKAINIPVNAISAVNAEHLKDKYNKLNNLLTGKTVIAADRQVNASRHPQGVPFCMDLLAKKFVLQGDLMISSNPEAAFCYASIIVSLWNDFPDFGKLLLGYFYTQCPYLIPFYIPKIEEQLNEEYYQSLGYHYIDGQIEKQDKFLKRMTGILRLYFAIFIAKPKRGQPKNPHDIKYAWNFLASILKLKPQLDITATVLHVFLETVGFEMEQIYGMAFKKLVVIIMVKFIPALKQIDTGGPVTRLEVLLQDYKTKGHFDKPNGILPNNFW